MTTFASTVVSLLAKEFGIVDVVEPCPKAQAFAQTLKELIQEAEDGAMDLSRNTFLEHEFDPTWILPADEDMDDYLPPGTEEYRFGERIIDKNEVDLAIAFFRHKINYNNLVGFVGGSMKAEPPVCEILRRDGLPTCATLAPLYFERNPDHFVNLFCGPRRLVHVPLNFLIEEIRAGQDSISAFEMDILLEVIDVFKEHRKISDYELGATLDYILTCHLLHHTFSTVSDITCLFSVFQSSHSETIFDNMKKTGGNEFWQNSFGDWMSSYGISRVPLSVVQLLKSGGVLSLSGVFSHSATNEISEFLNEIDDIQRSSTALPAKQWQRIINKCTGGENIEVILEAALGRCFMNWLTGDGGTLEESDLVSEIMTLFMALVQDREWRFADLSKLFRFSRKPEDLPRLLAALTQVYEANLKSSALEKLPSALPADAIGDMLESDMEFESEREIPRDEAIRLIVNSDFSSYTHESAQMTEFNLHEMMASFDQSYLSDEGEYANVVKAVKIVENFENIKMRDVQILAVLLAKAARSASVPRLLQMQTGEGKTYVIAAIAISEVLDGNKVDIITSSESLAVTQCADLRKLCSSIGITVEENCTMDFDQKEKAQIYEVDIMYGSAAKFMFDALHQDFYETNIRGKRGYPLAIVDEVDSQMLDHANYVCRFAGDTSGMGNLLAIKATVWMLVSQNFKEMKQDENGWTVSSDDGESRIEDVATLKKYFKDGLSDVLQKMAAFIPGASEDEKVGIPWTLWDYAKTELPLWIDSAVEAFMKRKDFDYCVDDGEVVIVDSGRSGTRNKGMRWGHGLHEFLEMLNAANLKPEILSMCFLSTLSFCKRYKTNLIGLTGTIGGTASRKFLSDVYEVDFVEIPPFMYWRHIKLPHVFCSNTAEWLTAVVERVVDKLNEGRACLVITQYIHFADVLNREISQRVSGHVGTYTGSRSDISVNGKLSPGTCIIATNIAGRGTDLKIADKVEEAGGLHVVLTSLPENDRVERQNIGRASRTGQRGTSQMILNWEHIDPFFLENMLNNVGEGANHTVLVNTLKEVRDEWNLKNIEAWIQQMTVIEKADSALQQFIEMRNECVAKFKKEDDEKAYFQNIVRGAINFRFGVYMTICDWALDPDKIKEDFGDLKDISMENVVKCFHDYSFPVFAAWNVGLWDPEEEPEVFELVQKLFGRAIELDPQFAGGAYYMRGVSFLFLYLAFDKRKYIIEAIDDFEKCRSVIERLEDQYKLAILSTKKKDEAKTKLETNMERLLNVASVIKNSIDILVGKNVTEELEKCRSIMAEQQMNADQTGEMEKHISDLEENRDQIQQGILNAILENGHEISFKMSKLEEMVPESMNKEEHKRELDHFYNEGYMRLVTVIDVPPIDFWDVLVVAALGVLQIGIGGMLIVFTGGAAAAIGIGLMLNGAYDIYTAYKDGVIDRNFNWKLYGLGKVIDILTLALPAGSAGLKAAAKGIVQGVKTVAKVGTSKVAKEALKHGSKQAVKTTVTVGTKIATTETLNSTVAAPLRDAVSQVLLGAIKTEISSHLNDNQDLHTLVDRDNSNNNKVLCSEFVNRAYDDFVHRVSSDFLDMLRKTIGNGIHGNLSNKGHGAAELVKFSVDAWTAAQVAANVLEFLKFLPDLLKSIVSDSHGYSGTVQYSNREYEQQSTLSVDDVITDLSLRLSQFCAMKAVSRARDFVSSKVSHMIVDRQFKKTDQQLEHFKKGFTLSHDVAQRARNAKSDEPHDYNIMLEHVASVAENMDNPGDRFQAKYLAEAVQSPIEIEYSGQNGETNIIVYGKEYSENPPIRLRFEQGSGPIGHYSFKDGSEFRQSGKNTCLFDTVSHATEYEVKDLKKAAANFMLDDVATLKYVYFTSSYADLLVGGVRNRGPPVSVAAQKHVEECETIEDVLRKSNNRQTTGKFLVPKNTVVNYDRDKFDNQADESFDKWIQNYRSTYGTDPPDGRFGVPQHDYFHVKSDMYEVKYDIDKKKQTFTPTEMRKYQAKAFFAVEEYNGPVHYDDSKTVNPNHPNNATNPPPKKNLVWRYGDSTDRKLDELT